MSVYLFIDGFEGLLAHVEWEARLLDLPRAWLPHAAAEGDPLSIELAGDGRVRFSSFVLNIGKPCSVLTLSVSASTKPAIRAVASVQ